MEDCKAWLAQGLKDSRVRFISAAMKMKGCAVPPSYFRCAVASTNEAAGQLEHGKDGRTQITLFANCVGTKRKAHNTMRHELLHAYDYCRARVDWRNLFHHACTEVRAANLSGDCDFGDEARRGRILFKNHHRDCVRRRAVLSVAANKACLGTAQAEEAVEKVFDLCYADLEPFGSVP